MTATTVSGAVAVRQKQDQVVAWIRAQQDDIAMIAASHVKPSAIVRVTQGALRRNEKLMAAAIANPQSLLYALLDAARLGHEPDTDDYYLVPFGNEVTGIEGYKGIIERMYRAGGVSSVVAQVVRQRDRYSPRGENTPPLHEYDDFASPDDRGPMRGAYAYAVFPDGRCSQVIRMGRAEIMEHKAKSRGSERSDSPWQQWEGAMWKKTVLRALEPYVPTSTEYRNAARPSVLAAASPHPISASASTAAAVQSAQESASPAAEIVDAELIPDPGAAVADEAPASSPAATPNRTLKPGKLETAFTKLGLDEGERADVIRWLVPNWTGSRADQAIVASTLDSYIEHTEDVEEARSQMWDAWHKAMDGQQDEAGSEVVP